MIERLSDSSLTNIVQAVAKLAENIRDELLSFSLILVVALLFFPDIRWWIFSIWFLTFCGYVGLKIIRVRDMHDGVLQEFRKHLRKKTRWRRMVLRGSTLWVFQDNPLFQLELGEDVVTDFHEPWLLQYPDMAHNFSCYVYIKYQNTVIDQVVFVFLDGLQYFVPVPEVDEQNHFFYERGSLSLAVAGIIGTYHIDRTVEEFAKRHGIKILSAKKSNSQ